MAVEAYMYWGKRSADSGDSDVILEAPRRRRRRRVYRRLRTRARRCYGRIRGRIFSRQSANYTRPLVSSRRHGFTRGIENIVSRSATRNRRGKGEKSVELSSAFHDDGRSSGAMRN